jgi:hypothetical protein
VLAVFDQQVAPDGEDSYTSESLNKWTAVSLNADLWLLELQNASLKNVLLVLPLAALLIFDLLDLCLHTPAIAVLVVLLLSMPCVPLQISIQKCAQVKRSLCK